MKLQTILPVVFFCLCFRASAQAPCEEGIKTLNIGDAMPDVSFAIENYEKPTVRFSDFKDKIVLLDFWFGTCTGCLESFPKLEALQDRFKDRLQIVMVNFESQGKIDSNFARRRRSSPVFRNPKLPSVVSDTLFHRLFSFRYYPHLVWIDSKGVIRAFTATEDVTEKNIRLLLEENRVGMDMKLDDMRFDHKTAVLPQAFKYFPSHVKYYSSITSYMDGVNGVGYPYLVDSASNTVKILIENASLLDLVGYAVSNGVYWNPFNSEIFDYGKRVDLRIKDSSRWFFRENRGLTKKQWVSSNVFTYEALQPLDTRPHLFELMRFDLEKFLKISWQIEKREMECLALVRTSKQDKIRSKEGKSLRPDDPRINMNTAQFYASKTEWLVNAIARANRNTPFVFNDDTGYEDRIDIEINKKAMGDLPSLRKELAKYDLDLVKKRKVLDVLIITENE